MDIVNKVEKSAWDLPDRFDPDEEDTKLLSRMVVKPLMEQSTKWRSFHNDAPEWVKFMVMRGEMPTAKIKKAWIDIAATPSMYMSGLTELLGKIQEEYQKNPDRHTEKLVPDKLLITAMGMDCVYTLDLDTNMVAVCGKTGSGCLESEIIFVIFENEY